MSHPPSPPHAPAGGALPSRHRRRGRPFRFGRSLSPTAGRNDTQIGKNGGAENLRCAFTRTEKQTETASRPARPTESARGVECRAAGVGKKLRRPPPNLSEKRCCGTQKRGSGNRRRIFRPPPDFPESSCCDTIRRMKRPDSAPFWRQPDSSRSSSPVSHPGSSASVFPNTLTGWRNRRMRDTRDSTLWRPIGPVPRRRVGFRKPSRQSSPGSSTKPNPPPKSLNNEPDQE